MEDPIASVYKKMLLRVVNIKAKESCVSIVTPMSSLQYIWQVCKKLSIP